MNKTRNNSRLAQLRLCASLFATAGLTVGCLDEQAANAPLPRLKVGAAPIEAVAKAVRIGPSYALAAQPEWRQIEGTPVWQTLETAAGPETGAAAEEAMPNLVLAQYFPPTPGRSGVTTLNTLNTTNANPAETVPGAPGRTTSITLNARPGGTGRAPIVLSLPGPATPPPAAPIELAQPTAPATIHLPPLAEPAATDPAQAAPEPLLLATPTSKPVPPAEGAAPGEIVAATPTPAKTPANTNVVAATPKGPKLADIANRAAWRVQIASLNSADAAEGTWARLKTANADLLGALAYNIERAELGARGTYFRVQTDGFQDKASADELCRSLKARNLECIVIRSAT